MIPNEVALSFKQNLTTDEYVVWYEALLKSYHGLIWNFSKVNSIFDEDLFNTFVCALPHLIDIWKPEKAQFSTYLTIWLKGTLRQDYIARNTVIPLPRKDRAYYVFSSIEDYDTGSHWTAEYDLEYKQILNKLSSEDLKKIYSKHMSREFKEELIAKIRS